MLCGDYAQSGEQCRILCSRLETFQTAPLYLLRTANHTAFSLDLDQRERASDPSSETLYFPHMCFIEGPGDAMNKSTQDQKKFFKGG